ncbi:hypothetical protein AB3Y40_07835 [Yoonia sp. R2331]|uniref:hypothetical protein n=1 Tax=Yoonia sp. R2331 TaxID=3237238 RepID=UPI0034E58C4B
MNITETVGMMSTGALLTIGVGYFMGAFDQPAAQQQIAQQQPAAVVQTAPAPQVTRATTDLTEVSPVNQIEAIVALSEQGLSQDQELSDEQREVIAFFEDTARAMNEADRDRTSDTVQFSNMAVSDLKVRYFYTVPARYDALNVDEIMTAQAQLVNETLCQGDAIQTLMQDYGFEYVYTYISSDHRMIGAVQANAATCAG